MIWLLIPLFLLCVGLSTFYGAALAGLAALGRFLEERDRTQQPPGLSGFILRDATTVMAAWVVGGFVLGLTSVLLLAHVMESLLPAWPRWGAFLVALLIDTGTILAGLNLWKRQAEAEPRTYCTAAAVLGLPAYLLIYPVRKPLSASLARLYPPFTLRAGVLFSEDVKEITQNGDHARLLDRDEREMIQRVFLLGETVVREIMVPRIDMVAVEERTPIADIVQLIRDKRHSRLPVYRDSVDNIIGFLHIKDVLAQLDQLENLQLANLMRPAYFVPETKRADDLLSEMRARRMHLAIVVDEYGGTAGLVTLEDVIEEVVGEIQDESDKEQPLVRRRADGSFTVDAKVDLDDLNERLEVELPADDYDTLGGFLYGLAGKIPKVGERFKDSGLEFMIAEVRGKRITQVIVRPLQSQTLDDSSGA